MLVIGELINGMYQNVEQAIKTKNRSIIHKLAKEQLEAGADMLDINAGPHGADPKETMRWLIETIREVTPAPLAIDSTKLDVVELGLKLAGEGSMINSTKADDEKLDIYVPLAKKYKAKLIGLTMDKKGVPRDKNVKCELAAKILAKCMEMDLPLEDVYIDPIVLPVNVAQAQCAELLDVLREFKLISDPPPQTVVGLSNVSQGTKQRSLINRTYLVMAVASGLSGAIVDPLDKELMDAMITAELLLNKNIYCDSYIDAYRKR
ncbi:MAG: methyltetrahydrofolate--corrinoid methyltransferase [Candidatus Omnitrophica bacterium CG07_land_8_20_14_0_80_42_15]|uniref:Methyltetrahydrofolate--corrinoid methyltransferase n=1 Tax=Candidatus Aquitaenariimonas noxiae TaxID=1974741 RepID=A0A2J0L690_9BACT|nr:MAG: methyltetrahydrofolate--corrinoid methyltransferase [Candidatus Omnitrophica bacterium CG07_land_8_20_14_0_80_42_15]